MSRLERFRSLLARVNPARDPRVALDEGYYVAPTASVAREIAVRLELEPTSSHLVLGGIGSGKTTELLAANAYLQSRHETTGDHAIYVDVSRYHNIERSLRGVLTALAGQILAARCQAKGELPQEVAQGISQLERFAAGYTNWIEPGDEPSFEPDEDNYRYRYPVRVPGVLIPPIAPLGFDLERLIPFLRMSKEFAFGASNLVLLFDSLDRLGTVERFAEAVVHDVRLLKLAGIGVVVVGPLRLALQPDRILAELFDQSHVVVTPDPVAEGSKFLEAIVRGRVGSEMVSDEAVAAICRGAGGVVRDMLQVTKAAADVAYLAGEDKVELSHVTHALAGFGRSLAVGLDSSDVTTLKHLNAGYGFVLRGDRELRLVETRRILLYPGSKWVVNPSLAPILDQIPTPNPGVLI